MAGFGDCSQLFLFRPIFRSGNICKLIHKHKQLSYTAARENIISRLKLDAGNLNKGLHSLRSEGPTATANFVVDNRCLNRHGWWKTDTSKDGYIINSVQKRLNISQTLGLWLSFLQASPQFFVCFLSSTAGCRQKMFCVLLFLWK